MKINKNSLMGYFPLSCVEQYFLTWIERNGINDGKLYTRSFATISEVYENIVNSSYENFLGVERVMDVAQRYGYISYSIKNVMETDEDIQRGDLVLVETTNAFFETMAFKPWRQDHYIWLLEKNSNIYSYINQYPLSEGCIAKQELLKYTTLKSIVYKFNDGNKSNLWIKESLSQLSSIIEQKTISEVSFQGVSLETTRNFLGIMKVLRERVARWLCCLYEIGLIELSRNDYEAIIDYNKKLNLLFVKAEASIKRKKDMDIESGILQIIHGEKELRNIVKRSLK